MRVLSKLFSWLFGKKNGPGGKEFNRWVKELKWLEPNENDFGIPVLDCHSFVSNVKVKIRSNQIADNYYDSRDDSGDEFRGKSPENAITIPCQLEYQYSSKIKEGILFKSPKPEVKWDIYYFQNKIYFVRSWSGDLILKTNAVIDQNRIKITQIEASPEMLAGSNELGIEQVNFLIKSHLFGEKIPHPIPQNFHNDPKEIALYSITCYGAYGYYATFENTLKLN